MVASGVTWIKSCQTRDGGWGEDLMSYQIPALAGQGKTTPSQTAWALMALLSHTSGDDTNVIKGIRYLSCSQAQAGSAESATWTEHAYTGTGFPGHFYFGYEFYSHYFPMMALGRYIKTCRKTRSRVDSVLTELA